MKTLALTALAGMIAAAALAAPAAADVFSSQTFTGETSTLNALPGVNLDAGAGVAANGGGNCVESTVPAFSMRGPAGGTMTECRFGNFSFGTVRQRPAVPLHDNTYGGNPPPWLQGWRPSRLPSARPSRTAPCACMIIARLCRPLPAPD